MNLNQYKKNVSLANWREGPHSRWAFQNVRQLIPTATIAGAPVSTPFAYSESTHLSAAIFDGFEGKSLETVLNESHTDSVVVLRKGSKAWQWQAQHCDIEQPHIVFSVSKSITAMLAGVLVGQGVLDTAKPVLHYLPGVKGSAYADCSLQQLLDMQVALSFEESYLDTTGDYRRYRNATGWNPVDQKNPGPDLEEFLYSLKKTGTDHGDVFAYKSPNSDLLGLLIERAAGMPYADLLSKLIWQPLGAASDGYVTVDRSFLARGAGGICVKVDDLARFGQLILDGGFANNRQIIPQSWIQDTSSAGSRSAWLKGDFVDLFPQGGYRNQWYQAGDSAQSILAIGIHGQWLYINPAAEVVIAKMASQPVPLDDSLDSQTLAVFAEIVKVLTNTG